EKREGLLRDVIVDVRSLQRQHPGPGQLIRKLVLGAAGAAVGDGIIGVAVLMRGLETAEPRQPGLGQIGLAKISLAALDRLPALEREREPLAPAEQIAMLPEPLPAKTLGVEAFTGRIAEAAADRARLALDQCHGHRQPALGIERLRVSDFYGREQPGVDERAARLV